MAIEALEGLTDQELFDGSNSDEAVTEEVVAEPAGEVVEQTEQARDEAGRFAGKPENEPEAPVATDPPARTPVDDNAPQVPSWRVREINEERRTALAERDALRAEKAQWEARQQQAQRVEPVTPQPAPEEPDPLLDPKGYREFVLNQTREVILNDRREASLHQAHRTYKTEFDDAYKAAQQAIARGDPVIKQIMQQSREPGETLIQWHREQKTRAEVGNDPNAYFDKRFEAYLADPANQAKVLERIRGGVQPAGNGRPAPTSLPPSLTRATNAAVVNSADDDDVSDEGLWRSANA